MFLIGTEIKKEESAVLFPKPDYIELREELYFLYNVLDFLASNTISDMWQAQHQEHMNYVEAVNSSNKNLNLLSDRSKPEYPSNVIAIGYCDFSQLTLFLSKDWKKIVFEC